MADRPFKAPKKEGTSIESSVKKRSDIINNNNNNSNNNNNYKKQHQNQKQQQQQQQQKKKDEEEENKSRSPIITRSRSRNNIDDKKTISRKIDHSTTSTTNNNNSSAISRSSKKRNRKSSTLSSASASASASTSSSNSINTNNNNIDNIAESSNSFTIVCGGGDSGTATLTFKNPNKRGKLSKESEITSSSSSKTIKIDRKSNNSKSNKKVGKKNLILDQVSSYNWDDSEVEFDNSSSSSSSSAAVIVSATAASAAASSAPVASSSTTSSNNNKNRKRKLSNFQVSSKSSKKPKKSNKVDSNSKATTKTNSKKSNESINNHHNSKINDNKKSSSSTHNRIVMDQNGANNFSNISSANSASSNGASSATNNETSSTQLSPSTSALFNYTDDSTDETDMNRLQTILESRGLPQHFLGIPRMQNLFYRSLSGSSSNTKAQQLLNALNSTSNDSEKLHYVMEMCNLLLMGNEDTLVGFPIKSVVPTLVNLLSMEQNFDIMHHACRALTYMMEALPRSSVAVLDAIPVFLEKLQVIQCMDVAEQSLSALEMLSRRHNKSILHAKGVSACLTYLDFFSIAAQRSALAITANCFQNLSTDDFQYVQDSLSILGGHLTIEDKKCIESICLAFYRLVECYQNDCVIISEIASTELLTNIQNVLMTMPPILSTGSFVNVIRMLSIMCLSCSQIAVELLKLNICETLKCLLLCNNDSLKDKSDSMNLISRSPQEICELTSFIAELMPSLPLTGIFSIDISFSKTNSTSSEVAVWQWKDDRGLWQTFNVVDNRIIEAAHISGEDEIELASLNRTYIVDFNSMQKICEDTGNSYAIQRKTNIYANSELYSRSNLQSIDPRSDFISKEKESTSNFIKFAFKVLYEVYNNSAGYSVRYKCLNAILRIIYYSPKELLHTILEDQSISSSIATMLASHDMRIVVCAVQMCNILMEKMPDIFSVYFQREGVIHQMRKLYMDEGRFIDKSRSGDGKSISSNTSIVYSSNSASIVLDNNGQMFLNRNDMIKCIAPANFASISQSVANETLTTTTNSSSKTNSSSTSSEQLSGRDDLLRRKRTRKSTNFSSSRNTINYDPCTEGNAASNAGEIDLNLSNTLSTTYLNNLPMLVSDSVNGATNLNISAPKSTTTTRLGTSKDFLQRLNPSRWARWAQNTVNPNSNVIPTTSSVTTKDLSSIQKSSSNNNKDKIKIWIKEQGKIFDDKYFKKTDQIDKDAHVSSNILNNLRDAIQLVKQDASKGLMLIKNILLDSDLSSFELIHSGLVKNLLAFLISSNEDFTNSSMEKREKNLRTFLHIFIGAPSCDMSENIDETIFDSKPFLILVNKLNGCLSQLEQFPIRIQDYSAASRSGTHPLKFLSSHFLKISLNRHPTCTNLRKYKGPLIKLDPFTPVTSIERYLSSRGYAKIKDNDEDPSDDDLSDEDSLDIQVGGSSSQPSRHRLQLLMGEHVLPYNIPLYQGIKQFMANDNEHEMNEDLLTTNKFWSSTFIIYYRLATESNTASTSSTAVSSSSSSNANNSSSNNNNIIGQSININNNNNSSSNSSNNNTQSSRTSARRSNKSKANNKKKDELWLEGKVQKSTSPLEPYLKNNISINININDQSMEVILLLRVLYGINRYWGHLYRFSHIYRPLIPLKGFVNNKLTVKANRQLQDPMMIMTGTLPNWLSELAYACPFMFPFHIRYILFYVVCFDRDRALHRLFETTPDLSSDPRDRSVPRLEKRRKIISRNDIFRSAESLFNDVSNSKSVLEVQYENEVGTGLGPTLEFYALVSKEFQRAELEMWRGEVVTNNIKNEKIENTINYINSNYGLFPVPIGRNTKPATCNKLKHRFKLLGKFMAKALMDSRMIDMNLNILFYKWLLNEESTLSVSDLYHLDYTFFSSISQMYKIAQKKSKSNVYSNNSDNFRLQGSSIDDLNIDFIMPGYPNFELRKGGKDLAVTLNNLENYIDLVSHWSLLEGISKQMEAFKEGFNSVFDLSHLKLFYAEELQQLFCGSSYKSWDQKMLMDSCKCDHGFTHESKAIKYLFEILSSYNDEEQRKFLQFLTGFPRLPIGGFKSLNPPFTIVKKSPSESDNPNCLPSVMTCVNYLKLPDYPTVEIMREKLKIAISEGQFSFHLS